MTHDDLYPCDNCGRDNLYPGPCASCEHATPTATFDPAPAMAGFNPCDGSGCRVLQQHGDAWDPAAVIAAIKPAAAELGRHIILPPAPEPRRPVDGDGDDMLAVGEWIRKGCR